MKTQTTFNQTEQNQSGAIYYQPKVTEGENGFLSARLQPVENLTNVTSNKGQSLKPIVRTAARAVFVTTSTFIPEFVNNHFQTNTPLLPQMQKGIAPVAAFFWASWKPLLNTYVASTGQGLMKQCVFTQHKDVHQQVSKVVCKNQDDKTEMKEPSPIEELVAGGVASLVLGTGYTFISQPLNNYKSLHSINKQEDVQALLKKRGIKIMFDPKFFKLAMDARVAGNASNVAAFAASETLIKKEVDKVFPPDIYGKTSAVISTLIASGMGGFINNFFGILYNNKIKETDANLKAPKNIEMIRKLHKEGGMKALRKGALPTIGITFLAFGSMKAADYAVDHMIFPDPSQSTKEKSAGQFGVFSKPLPQLPQEEMRQEKHQTLQGGFA